MNNLLSIKIPIKPHLKKFLLNGKKHRLEPLRATERSLLGICIMKTLMDNRKHKFDNVLKEYTQRIEIILTDDMNKRSPRLYKLVNINVELERVFKEHLYIWVAAQNEAGIPEYEACKNFIDHYKIQPNEYTYDAAERAWRRYKNDESKKDKDLGE